MLLLPAAIGVPQEVSSPASFSRIMRTRIVIQITFLLVAVSCAFAQTQPAPAKSQSSRIMVKLKSSLDQQVEAQLTTQAGPKQPMDLQSGRLATHESKAFYGNIPRTVLCLCILA